MDPRVKQALREAGVSFRENEPFSRHTSMGVGGTAAVMAFPAGEDELRAALAVRRDLDLPHRILGGGSNLVVADEGLDELVVNTRKLRQLELGQDGAVRAQAGAKLSWTVSQCCRSGWQGLESAAGIPGSLGGAAVMNAGAYGFSISEVMQEIVVYDADGERCQPSEGWSFHYRGSSIPEGFAVASVTLQLTSGDPETLQSEIRELQAQRVRSQPVGRNAGCVFKNPPGEAAGKIIDGLGLKGLRVGGALVSPRHANFIVNDQHASAADVLAVMDRVRETVSRETGVELEPEVRVWSAR